MSIPTKPTLTAPPTAPQRTDPRDTFANRADAYLVWQNNYRDELVAGIDWQNTVFTATETEANNAANSATASGNSATASANSATASANSATEAEGYKDTAETAAAAAQSAAGLPSLVGNSAKVLKVNGTEDGVLWGDDEGVIAAYQEFTASGTWNKDPNATWVYVEAIGGGGGGGNNTIVSQSGGGGGGFNSTLFRATDIDSSETVTIGAGGTGRASGVTGDPTTGGDSAFGTHITASGAKEPYLANQGGFGGNGEHGGSSDPDIAKGFGGFGSAGGGWSEGPGGDCTKGGAGGGGANNGAGGVSLDGGDGGAGSSTGKGSNGVAPGGGGGGSGNDSGGGDGGDGRIRVWQW